MRDGECCLSNAMTVPDKHQPAKLKSLRAIE
jgi:hypothetical protein